LDDLISVKRTTGNARRHKAIDSAKFGSGPAAAGSNDALRLKHIIGPRGSGSRPYAST